MSIQLVKKGTDTGADTDNYKKNLWRHRLRQFGIGAGVLAAVCLCIATVRKSYQSRTFETYEVLSTYERTDTMTTRYTEFLNYVLKYSNDGVSCVDSSNNLIWSQTYNMQNPMIAVCKGSAAIAEENGTEAMIFGGAGLEGNIQTKLPIRQISISSQGVLAALLEDGDVMRLKLYNKKGEELVESKFELKDAGYPLRMSLSADATKLAVTFLQVQDGSVNTCLAFYNFGSVGENQEDHLVAAQTVQGMVMPSVQYLDNTHCFAVGTGRLLLYEGAQIPEQVIEIEIDREIHSVFYSDSAVGLVLDGEEESYALQVYDVQGRLRFETEFDQEYRTLKFSGNNILIYNDFECMMMNQTGNIFFTGIFQESISNMYSLSGSDRFIIMHASRTDQIRLR